MKQNNTTSKLPNIPNKRYFTIGEVAHLCSVKPHVLRYWEQEFPQLRPAKRRGNRRYYQRADVIMVRNIRELLYDEGYTISGARIQLDQVVKQQKQADKTAVQIPEITYSYSFTVEADDTEQHLAQNNFQDDDHLVDEKIEFVTEPEIHAPQPVPAAKPKVINTQTPLNNNAATNNSRPATKSSVSMSKEEHLCKYKTSIKEAIVELRAILSELNHA